MGGRFSEITVVKIIRVPGGREMICETNSHRALHFPTASRWANFIGRAAAMMAAWAADTL